VIQIRNRSSPDPCPGSGIIRRRWIDSGRAYRTRAEQWRSRWSRGSSRAPPSARSWGRERRRCRTAACCFLLCRNRFRRKRSCSRLRDGDGASRRWRQRSHGEPSRRAAWWQRTLMIEIAIRLSPCRKDAKITREEWCRKRTELRMEICERIVKRIKLLCC